jgi:hypothetical protein
MKLFQFFSCYSKKAVSEKPNKVDEARIKEIEKIKGDVIYALEIANKKPEKDNDVQPFLILDITLKKAIAITIADSGNIHNVHDSKVAKEITSLKYDINFDNNNFEMTETRQRKNAFL